VEDHHLVRRLCVKDRNVVVVTPPSEREHAPSREAFAQSFHSSPSLIGIEDVPGFQMDHASVDQPPKRPREGKPVRKFLFIQEFHQSGDPELKSTPWYPKRSATGCFVFGSPPTSRASEAGRSAEVALTRLALRGGTEALLRPTGS
jgi:hypothetical protein